MQPGSRSERPLLLKNSCRRRPPRTASTPGGTETWAWPLAFVLVQAPASPAAFPHSTTLFAMGAPAVSVTVTVTGTVTVMVALVQLGTVQCPAAPL